MLYPFCRILLEDNNRSPTRDPKFNLFIGEGLGSTKHKRTRKTQKPRGVYPYWLAATPKTSWR
jgi:hypothetical protein